jgi:hypothetical protein
MDVAVVGHDFKFGLVAPRVPSTPNAWRTRFASVVAPPFISASLNVSPRKKTVARDRFNGHKGIRVR